VRGVARLISVIFHPLLLSTWVVLFFSTINKYSFGASPAGKIAVVVFINTFFFPAFTLFLMYKLEFIPDLQLKNKQDRTIPFFAAMIFYIWSFMAAQQMQMPVFIQLFILGATISICLCFFVNIFYKVSLHMAGMGGLLMLLLLMVFLGGMDVAHMIVGVIILAGLVGTSRLAEKAHTLNELYYGLLLGLMGQMVGVIVFNRIIMA